MSEITKLSMQTPDLTQANIDTIAQLFPHVVTEAEDEDGNLTKKIDFDLLRQSLSKDLVEDTTERYRLDRPGKKRALLKANTPLSKTLRPVPGDSVNWDTTQNLYLEGDNFEILKILQESYLGKIKMIYIDPPYNTGKDFVYKDDFKVSKSDYESELGAVDEEGGKLFKNTDTNGRYHSDWLSMMYSRLIIARDFLKDDGIIFISIDDNELHNLKKICDEIFGEHNLLECFNIQVRYSNKSLNEKDDFQKLIEYTLIYAKDKQFFSPSKPFEEYDLSKFCYEIKEKVKGEELLLGGKKVEIFKKGEYEIIKHDQGKIGLLKDTRASGSVLLGNTSGKFFDNNIGSRKEIDGVGCLYKVYGIGEDGIGYRYFTGPKKDETTKGQFFSGVPLSRVEELKVGSSKKYRPIINFYDYSGDFGNIRHEGGIAFNAGKKPVKMLKYFMEIVSNNDYEFIVLDFFSGSASVAHAVMQLNAQDGGSRKFIMAQLPEETDPESEAYKAGYHHITDIGKERIRRAGKKILEENKDKLTERETPLDIGFRVYRTDTTNMKDVYYHPSQIKQSDLGLFTSNIKDDRTPHDLLTQVILDRGLTLDLPMRETKIGNNTVFYVADNALVACFDEKIDMNIIDQIAECLPLKVIFRDASFKDVADRINVETRMKRLSPDTQIRVI